MKSHNLIYFFIIILNLYLKQIYSNSLKTVKLITSQTKIKSTNIKFKLLKFENTMMLSDPWDLKHQIQQLQQQERYSKNLLQKQYDSSSNYSEDFTHANGSNSGFYATEKQQQHHLQQVASEENSLQQPIHKAKIIPLQKSYQTQNHQSEFIQPKNKPMRKKYGNLVVFFQTTTSFLSIGPNYIFFSFAYLCFTLASIYLVKLVNESMQNIYFKIFNFSFCLLQNLSYLLVAFSNPGVQLPEKDIFMSSDSIKENRYCKKCSALQERKTYHCRQCDICVKDYDHHCPWTSKCIGGGNLKRFYMFVGLTPFYIFYYIIAFMICMASLAVTHNSNLKPQSAPMINKI